MKETIVLAITGLLLMLMLLAGHSFDKYIEVKYNQPPITKNELLLKILNLESRMRFVEREVIKKKK